MKIARILLVGVVVFGLGVAAMADGPSDSKAPAKASAGLFTDVPADHWAAADLKYLAERGIITGQPNGQYQGDKSLSRYSAAALMARTVRYLQNNPELVTAQELKVMQDLMFKVSEKVQSLDQQMGQLRTGQPPLDTGGLNDLQSRLQRSEQKLSELQRQVQQYQISSSQGTESELERLKKQANANFIIALAGLFVGIIGLALATL